MTYAIYLKDKPVSPCPDSYWSDIESAHAARLLLEIEEPRLDGKLEVRSVKAEQ